MCEVGGRKGRRRGVDDGAKRSSLGVKGNDRLYCVPMRRCEVVIIPCSWDSNP